MRSAPLLLLGALLLAPLAHAEDMGDTRRFLAPLGPSTYLTLDDSQGYGAGRQAFGLLGAYEARPLIFYRGGRKTADVIAGRALMDLTWGYGLHRRLNVTARLPLLLSQEGRAIEGGDLPSFALLDPALGFKALLTSRAEGLGLALAGHLTLPLDGGESYASEAGVSARVSLIAELPLGPRVDALLNLGYLTRLEEGRLDQVTLGDELSWGLGASWRPALDWVVLGELRGGARASAPFEAVEEAPVGGDLAARRRVWRRLAVVAGLGGGLSPGYGAPAWRASLGLEWGPWRYDADDDGVEDDLDHCPKAWGLSTHQGCPRAASPRAAVADRDDDGVEDDLDRCPLLPEDVDGFLDEDGCPDPDDDLDFIPDAEDKAPRQPEDWDGDEDGDGAPDLTSSARARPARPSKLKLSGRWTRVEGPDAPLLLGETLHPAQPLRFAPGSAKLDAQARGLVDKMAEFLKLNEAITWVEVAAHTDARDKPAGAFLSTQRAHAVRRRLIQRGISPKRLKAQGYGARVPLAPSTTPESRAKNRRVTLRILHGAPSGHWSAKPKRSGGLAPPRDDWLPPDAVVLRPRPPLRFAPGAVEPSNLEAIEALAKRIEAHPEFPCLEIGVHSDGRGDLRDKIRLTTARAEAIREALIDAGIDARRLLIKGYGASRRIRSDATPRGRRKNRRVELWVRPKRYLRKDVP